MQQTQFSLKRLFHLSIGLGIIFAGVGLASPEVMVYGVVAMLIQPLWFASCEAAKTVNLLTVARVLAWILMVAGLVYFARTLRF